MCEMFQLEWNVSRVPLFSASTIARNGVIADCYEIVFYLEIMLAVFKGCISVF